MNQRHDDERDAHETWEQEILREMRASRRHPRPAGYYSNAIIRARNGGVRHQFEDDIGGCSANYR
jgi:hypothetical protein